jgi:hypothetical protein
VKVMMPRFLAAALDHCLRMTTLNSWNVVIFTVSIVLVGFAGFKAGERSKNAGGIVDSTLKGHEMPRTPPTEAPLGELNSKIEVESDEEALADGNVASVQTNGPCKLASEPGVLKNSKKMTVWIGTGGQN